MRKQQKNYVSNYGKDEKMEKMKRNLEIKGNLRDVNQLKHPDFTWF